MTRTRIHTIQLMLSMAAVAMIAASAWAAPAKAGAKEARLTAGKAYVERLGRIYSKPAGMFAVAKGGDWRLGNEHVAFTFVSTNDFPTTYSMPIEGYEEIVRGGDRTPGALIDISLEGAAYDTLGYLTQSIGLEASSALVKYDTAEPVRGDNRVGLRLTGSPFENRLVRLETTYWLAEGSYRLSIESRFIDIDPDERVPDLVDAADWGVATPLIDKIGKAPHGKPAMGAADFLLCDESGVSTGMALEKGKLYGSFQSVPSLSRVLLTPAIDNPTTGSRATRQPTANEVYRRDLWVARGHSAEALEMIARDRHMETGTVSGRVELMGAKQLPGEAVIQVQSYERGNLKSLRTMYAVKAVNKDGSYKISLPADKWFFFRCEMRGAYQNETIASYHVMAGKDQTNKITLEQLTGARVQVVDAATSKSMPARLRIEPIYPTQPVYFGGPDSADGYLNNMYIPKEGRMIMLPEGHWKIYATHGIEYEIGTTTFRLARGGAPKQVISLTRSNPTTGSLGMMIGARTSATPGVAITPEDLALMAAAEGLHWVVVTDFERITDMNPVINKLGLADRLRASAGFSTILPAHPDWGPFLVYPVAADAPDPAKASSEWAGAKTAGEFFATLRRLYPGAIIHCELPYVTNGPGYFNNTGKHMLETAYEGAPGFDFGFDALSLIPMRGSWEYSTAATFWYALWVGGHGYPAASRPGSTFVLGSEPGYPRVLVNVGQDDPAKVTEKALFEAFRKMRTQLTDGPFIQMHVDQQIAGDVIPRDENKYLQVRVTAPTWIDLRRMQITKDGASSITILGLAQGGVQRYPDPPDVWQKIKIYDLKLRDFKDTLVGAGCMGTKPLDDAVPGYAGSSVYPFAIISPIIIDANGNGKYDKLKDYGEKGR